MAAAGAVPLVLEAHIVGRRPWPCIVPASASSSRDARAWLLAYCVAGLKTSPNVAVRPSAELAFSWLTDDVTLVQRTGCKAKEMEGDGRIRRYRHALPLFVASMALQCPGGAVAFMSRSQNASLTSKVKVAPLFGTMLRQSLLKASGKKRKGPTPKGGFNDNSRSLPVISLDFLIGVTREALFRQRRITEALQEQDGKQEEQKANDSVKKRRIQIEENVAKIKEIQNEIKDLHQAPTVDVDLDTLQAIKDKLIELGFRSLLSQGPDGWKHVRELCRSSKAEFGRPADFNGLVLKSPLGVPILVGRKGGHHDEVLRRVAQGNDLWFQVEDYSGSRVLLRTSLMRGLKNSKACRQAAADIAAYFSDYRRFDSVPIMYTDSKRVAKRGSKIGQMRKRKSLGTIYGLPGNVSDICKGKEPI